MWLKRRSRRLPLMRGAIGGLVIIMLAEGAMAEQTTNEPALASIRARIQDYQRAWNSHDGNKVAAFYAEDADMVMGNSPRIIGRQAIAEWWTRYFAAISDKRDGAFELVAVRLYAPNVAVADVNTLTSGHAESGDALPARRARGTWVLTRSNGQWLISVIRGLPAEGDSRVQAGKDR